MGSVFAGGVTAARDKTGKIGATVEAEGERRLVREALAWRRPCGGHRRDTACRYRALGSLSPGRTPRNCCVPRAGDRLAGRDAVLGPRQEMGRETPDWEQKCRLGEGSSVAAGDRVLTRAVLEDPAGTQEAVTA